MIDLGNPVLDAGLAAAHASLAVLVTGHVLLHKRDVGSSVGWIGFAWLTPFLGAALYALLGVNRVQRRAQRLRGTRPGRGAHGPHDPADPPDDPLAPLALAIGRITGRPLEPDCVVEPLHDGDEAYPRMLDAIGSARRSVALSSYIFRDDAGGRPFIDALVAAHRRGVAVRVLIDGIGGGWLLSRAWRRLRRAGVPAERFLHSPLPWRMPFLNLRTHKKILCVDGRVGFTGGLNIAAQNLLRRHPRDPVQDTHFRVEGPVIAQLVHAFAADWAFANGETLAGDAWYPPLAPLDGVAARVVTSGPDIEVERIEHAMLQAVACARRSIVIATPYFLPDDGVITALALAAWRGVVVDILVPARSDHRFVDHATRAQIGPLLHAGARFWLQPPPFDHSKIMVVDRRWCLVGSANWDMRSLRLNFELCLELHSPELAGQLTRVVNKKRGTALTRATLAQRSTAIRLRDAAFRLLLPYL